MTLEQMTYKAELLMALAVIFGIVAVIIFFKMDIHKAWNTLKELRNTKRQSKSSREETVQQCVTTAQLLERHREQDNSATVLLNNIGDTTLLTMGDNDFKNAG